MTEIRNSTVLELINIKEEVNFVQKVIILVKINFLKFLISHKFILQLYGNVMH
jgi:hypothetical protein